MTSGGISVVVPVYRSAATLQELHDRLLTVLTPLACDFEIIFVDDGGNDDSWDEISRLSRADQRVRGILHSRNYGQHNALLTGIRAASLDMIVTLDDDLQNPPEEIPAMLAKLDTGYDVVYGKPRSEQQGLFRDLASRTTKLALQSAMGAETARNTSAFRVFRTFLREAFADYHNSFVSIDVLLTWGTKNFSFVTVKHDPRKVGESHYTLGKLARHAINMMTGFSVLPLQLASLIGFAFTLIGLGLLAFVVGSYVLYGSSVAGFPFLASVIALFSGAQMFALGIIGEYLARMHMRSMGHPVGLARMSIGFTADGGSTFSRALAARPVVKADVKALHE